MLHMIVSGVPISLENCLTACIISIFDSILTTYICPLSVTNGWQQVLLLEIVLALLVANNVSMKKYLFIGLYCINRSLVPKFRDRVVPPVCLLFWEVTSRFCSAGFISIFHTLARWGGCITLDFTECAAITTIEYKSIFTFVTLSKRSSRILPLSSYVVSIFVGLQAVGLSLTI